MGYTINGVTVTCDESISENEASEYVKRGLKKHPGLYEIILEPDVDDPEFIGVYYKFKNVPFERIRRITGYLVGTMDRWNDGKRAEESERVKHSV